MTDVFSSATTENVTTATTTTETTSSFVEQLVGEGKKFKDVESLAKGKLEADRHIAEITQTLAEMRNEIAKQDYAKTLLESLQSKGAASTANTEDTTQIKNSATENTTQAREVDLEALVEQAITKKEKTRTFEQNIATANEAMVSQFGEKAGEVVKARATELNMSVERLKEIAAESPTAFLQLITGSAKKPTEKVVTSGTVRTDSLASNTSDRTFEFYQKMRKENKSQYYSPKVQRMLMDDRLRLGDKFYS